MVSRLEGRSRLEEMDGYYGDVPGPDVLHSVIYNSLRRIRRKRPDKVMLYPGRDVWCWEVISRRLKMPSVYEPILSRSVVGNEKTLRATIDKLAISDWARMLCFDTGYAGTVPKAVARAAGHNVDFILLSAADSKRQVFPGHTGSRQKAISCEYLPKYRSRGLAIDDEAVQLLSGLREFIDAAIFSIWLWHHVSPRRVPSKTEKKLPRPKKKKRGAFFTPNIKFTSGHQLSVAGNYQPMTLGGGAATGTPVYLNSNMIGLTAPTDSTASSFGILDSWSTNTTTATTDGNMIWTY
jgi:glyoxylase-like metal-dependent hydrolase (beta-lactamase superfamily II)